jgi:hypothetical protein
MTYRNHSSRLSGSIAARLFAKLRQAERGEDSTFEYIVWVAPIMTMIFLIGVVVIYWGSRLPARAAATDCVRAAITTLEMKIGVNQGELAGIKSLARNNINAELSTPDVVVQVTPDDREWKRGDEVTCTVHYTIHLANSSNTPPGPNGSFQEMLTSPTAGIDPAALEIVETVKMKVDPLKSDWK